ncbi:ABC transporter permease [Millisia brevis]|uniref:ABC transporter permease n=1 Tax=Millisia brevis TaxID=264148 RepID=UPI000834F2E0|nr:ABC transporter permease [Millisia brevis]
MSVSRTLATAGRILRQLRHDHRTMAMLLVVPGVLIALVAWIFSDTPVFQRIGPAMIAMFPFIIMFLVASISTLRERRSGTLERLMALPIGRADLILGYTLAFGALAVVQSAIAVGVAVAVGLDIAGSLVFLFAVTIVDALLGTVLGLLASAFARTEFQVVQFMPVLVFPQILLGGVFLARDSLPTGLRQLSDVVPLAYAIDAMQAVADNSQSAGYILLRLLILAGFVVGAVVLAAATLRRATA